jgi:hypothetical protein
MQKGRRPAEVTGDGFANRDGDKMVSCSGDRFAKSAGCSDAGLSDRCGVGSWGGATPAGGRCSGKSTFACLLLARHSSLFDPRRRRGRILRDVPRPDADRRITARSDSHPISLMGAKRSGARRACGVDGASTVIAWTARDKIVCAPQAHAALLATGMEARKGGDAGRCHRRLRSRQPDRRRRVAPRTNQGIDRGLAEGG